MHAWLILCHALQQLLILTIHCTIIQMYNIISSAAGAGHGHYHATYLDMHMGNCLAQVDLNYVYLHCDPVYSIIRCIHLQPFPLLHRDVPISHGYQCHAGRLQL